VGDAVVVLPGGVLVVFDGGALVQNRLKSKVNVLLLLPT